MRRSVLVTGILLIALSALYITPACISMDKNEIESRLLALEKNRPVRELGLVRLDADARLLGQTVRATFTYYQAGEIVPGKPVIVLVHGTPSSMMTWTDVVFGDETFAGLAHDCVVYALDVAGHGTTRTQLDPYSFQACADWVGSFLQALDLRDVTLAGNSYGGEFVWRCALDHPDRVARVVLMSSSGFPRRDDEWLPEEVKMREWSVARWGYLFNSRSRIASVLQPHFQTPISKERLEEVFVVCDNKDNWKAMVDLARDENGLRFGELARMTQPVLLVWGENDIAYPLERFARSFEKTIPRVRLVIVPRSGHYPQEEKPELVADHIRAFVRS